MKLFIGRQTELKMLRDLRKSFQSKGLGQLVVIKGRRRVGKSRLAEEFGKGQVFLSFTGIFPSENTTSESQLHNFSTQFSRNFNTPLLQFTDWDQALFHLSDHLPNQPTVLLLDEISWMGAKDPDFVAKLKVWWDTIIQNKANVTLILCGSVSTWIDENIINSSAFFGRIALTIELFPLSLPESAHFFKPNWI